MARNKAAFAQEVHERQSRALLKGISFLMEKYNYTKYDFVDQGINKDTYDKFLKSEERKALGKQPLNINHSSVDKNLGIVLGMLMELRDRLHELWMDARECDADAAFECYEECSKFFDEIVRIALNF